MRVFEGLAEQGQTVIMVTHEPDIAAHARRVIVLRDGLVSSDDKRATFIKSAGIPAPDLSAARKA
jgi:ABC-type lipoprotein export system ATPase subunit